MAIKIPRKADLARFDSWEPALKAFKQLAVEHSASVLQQQMGASLGPAHLLPFAEASPD